MTRKEEFPHFLSPWTCPAPCVCHRRDVAAEMGTAGPFWGSPNCCGCSSPASQSCSHPRAEPFPTPATSPTATNPQSRAGFPSCSPSQPCPWHSGIPLLLLPSFCPCRRSQSPGIDPHTPPCPISELHLVLHRPRGEGRGGKKKGKKKLNILKVLISDLFKRSITY